MLLCSLSTTRGVAGACACSGRQWLSSSLLLQALNDLFEKILLRDVPARYLLRLGMGEQELATTLDFSRVGRVNAMLARRLELLAEVPPGHAFPTCTNTVCSLLRALSVFTL